MLGFKDLMALVGEFLLHWSAMEQQLGESISHSESQELDPPRSRGPLKKALERWQGLDVIQGNKKLASEVIDQIEQLRALRNLIVHGLAGANSNPDDGAEPYIKCVEGGWEAPGEERKVTVSELKHYSEAVDACRRGIRHPSHFNYRL
ncbi:hypothetical protein M3P36_14625 [Altererythrobacter sp. KTW20L]|uniref:hypothetical protein n=1 Tax=Altererythrobacter sp. KTW20L TaxID=2942210 RepID=UPI0020C16056|nr:hypothetical protein [Altererythrobacter sp. KTW20L]MCL6252274.1 hypothetical protein [Altererythrobacter sp. KTW20L]